MRQLLRILGWLLYIIAQLLGFFFSLSWLLSWMDPFMIMLLLVFVGPIFAFIEPFLFLFKGDFEVFTVAYLIPAALSLIAIGMIVIGNRESEFNSYYYPEEFNPWFYRTYHNKQKESYEDNDYDEDDIEEDIEEYEDIEEDNDNNDDNDTEFYY